MIALLAQTAADTAALLQPGAEVAHDERTPFSSAALAAGLIVVVGIALWLRYRQRRSTL